MEDHNLHFGRLEFSLITDFCFGTVSFDLHSSGELKFCNRVFPNKIGFSITNLDIISVIEDDEMFVKLSDDDAIRLCLLLALEGEHLWCHLYDEIKNLKERHGDEYYYGLFKDRNYVPTYTLSGFVFAFQVLAHERSDRQTKLKFTDEFSSMTSYLCDSLNSMFTDLIEPTNPDGDIAHLREEELRLCLEGEEKMRHIKYKFPLNDDYIVDWNFCLKLVCLDPARKGWLTEELLLQKGMPLFYANGERYTTPWSEVD
ncbi:hypothetical protein Tco_1474352 [Tanacetum coccineum]